MKYFVLEREDDETGISGTGIIAEGIIWSDGTVAYRWLTDIATTTIADNIETIKHLHGHDGKTKIRILQSWIDYPKIKVKK